MSHKRLFLSCYTANKSRLFVGSYFFISGDYMKDINEEIERAKRAIVETDSQCLKRDYTKYLKRLYKKLMNETSTKKG